MLTVAVVATLMNNQSARNAARVAILPQLDEEINLEFLE